jgi:hypothetical protein
MKLGSFQATTNPYRIKIAGGASRLASWLRRQSTYRVILVLGCVLLLLLLFGTMSFLLVEDMRASGSFPEGVSICGVYVGGLTRAQATEKCSGELGEVAARPLSLRIDEESYDIPAAGIDLELDYPAMVEEAYRQAWNTNIVERMGRSFFRSPRHIDVETVATSYNQDKVRAFVTMALEGINRPPHDAYIDVSTGVGRIEKAKDGRKVEFEDLLADTEAALQTAGRTVNVEAERTPAALGDQGLGKYMLVNIEACTLSLYDRDTLIRTYPVAVGSEEWPTVLGQWAVVKMEKNPTWYNRGSQWAENMPDSIPPGPNNPLGTRAMHLNGGGVLIHGTSNSWSVGRPVSHGCIRMHLSHVEELYENVEIGMPIYIIKRSGEPGFDCSKKPFWQK